MLSARSLWKHRPEGAGGCFLGPWLADGSLAKMVLRLSCRDAVCPRAALRNGPLSLCSPASRPPGFLPDPTFRALVAFSKQILVQKFQAAGLFREVAIPIDLMRLMSSFRFSMSRCSFT